MMSTLDGRTSKQCAGLIAALQSTNRQVFPWLVVVAAHGSAYACVSSKYVARRLACSTAVPKRPSAGRGGVCCQTRALRTQKE